MKIVNVVNTCGDRVQVDFDKKSIISYSNRECKIYYAAHVVENGKYTEPTVFCISGTVDSIEERIDTLNNMVRLAYYRGLNNDLSADPEKMLVDEVTKNQDKYFDKYGDWKEEYIIIGWKNYFIYAKYDTDVIVKMSNSYCKIRPQNL